MVRTVEVAAEDDVPVTIEMPEALPAARPADSPVQLNATDHAQMTAKDYAALAHGGMGRNRIARPVARLPSDSSRATNQMICRRLAEPSPPIRRR